MLYQVAFECFNHTSMRDPQPQPTHPKTKNRNTSVEFCPQKYVVFTHVFFSEHHLFCWLLLRSGLLGGSQDPPELTATHRQAPSQRTWEVLLRDLSGLMLHSTISFLHDISLCRAGSVFPLDASSSGTAPPLDY